MTLAERSLVEADSRNATDDDDLIAAVRDDPAAFSVLYRRYVDAVFRYCYRRLGDREAAEDATSLVFTKAIDALPRFREGGFRTWLFAIAHNTISNEMREHGKRSGRPIEEARSVPALVLILADIVYTPSRLGIPPGTDVALTLANVGQTTHTFNIDALDIHVEVEP